jgi:predicted extracellular nuclease
MMDANENIVDAVEKAESDISAAEARQIMARTTTANRLAAQMLEKSVKQRIQLARDAAQSAQDRANLAAVQQALNAAKSASKRAEDAGRMAAEAALAARMQAALSGR